MDVARLNFSHGTHAQHLEAIKMIREKSKELQSPVAILADMQGPKIRTSRLDVKVAPGAKSVIALHPGQELYFKGIDVSQVVAGNGTRENPIAISYPRLAHDLKMDDKLLVDDGLIGMKVVKTFPQENLILASVTFGKVLAENKGVNMPDAKLSTLGITEKDWDDILFAVDHDVDFIALSFVRSAREIKNLKAFLLQKKVGIQIVAKIEKAEAIENIDEILAVSDAIMVARGDLGVEIGNENVPIVQKTLIRRARAAGKPVITATQMLMSMVENPSPSRAEASDVANAVLDGSDALMLSNETATGNYPFESVSVMSEIIRGAESLAARDYAQKSLSQFREESSRVSTSEAIALGSVTLATSIKARCLACLTRSGQTAKLLSKYRPPIPIYAFAENEKVRNQLSLSWGISVIAWKEAKLQDYTIFEDLVCALGRFGLVQNGDLSVMCAGIPTSQEVGSTNTVVVKGFPPASRVK